MYGRFIVECLYCGHKNKRSGYVENIGKDRCPACKESKLLKFHQENKGEDIFGYRFSKEFPKDNATPENFYLNFD